MFFCLTGKSTQKITTLLQPADQLHHTGYEIESGYFSRVKTSFSRRKEKISQNNTILAE